MTRRTFWKFLGAAVAAPAALLWPKKAKAETLLAWHCGKLGRKVAMTTWWCQVHDGEWLFQHHDGPWCDEDWGRVREWDVRIAHYCEWGEVLDEEQLKFIGNQRNFGRFNQLRWRPLLLRYIPGEPM